VKQVVGIAVERGSVWFANRDLGEIGRLDPMTLQPVGTPVHIGGQPVWLARAGGDLFVGDASEGTVKRIDMRSGNEAGPAIRVASPVKDSPPLVIVPSGGSIWAGSFASNTLEYMARERDLLFSGAGLPDLDHDLTGRHVNPSYAPARAGDVRDSQAVLFGEGQVLTDVALRIDNRRRLRLLVADEV